MNDTLKTLVAYYEEEKERLLQYIDDYKKEWEYELAHFHVQALFRVNRRLQTLYSLQDRQYDEKSRKQNSIRYLEERLQGESSDYMREAMSKEVLQKKQELEKLNLISDPVRDPPNADSFNDILNNLLERRIKGFTLFLSEEDKFKFDFFYKANALKVVLPYVKLHLKTDILSEESILVLQDIGFTFKSNKSKLVLSLGGDKENVVRELKWRLAKIVFELFYFHSFTGKSCILVREKAQR